MKKDVTGQEKSPARLIDERIAELDDWRGEVLRYIRDLIKAADPSITEEWKWVTPSKPGTPVWSHNGIICTGESYKDHVKLTFARGASIQDPEGLFDQDGTVRRAIDIYQGDKINDSAFKDLVRAAVKLNLSAKKK